MSEMRTYECWVYVCGCRADMVSKPEAEAVFAAQDAKIAELKKERDWLAKDRAQAYDDLEKRAQLNIQKDAEICRLKKALYKACSNWAQSERYTEATWHGDEHREELWAGVEERCRAMANKFKEVQK